jgi:hypothetical protein
MAIEGRWGQKQTTAKAKCGGFSTAQQTMKPSAASVEMTHLFLCSKFSFD